MDVDLERGVMLRSDFIISQTRWTAFFSFPIFPITEALYDTILLSCTIRYDLLLRAAVASTIQSRFGVPVQYQSQSHHYYNTQYEGS